MAVVAAGDRVGVRELRQYLSVYLRRVRAGETLQVTEHGRVVAMLVPLPRARGVVARLVASGRAEPASRDLARLRVPSARGRTPLSRILQELRDEEPW